MHQLAASTFAVWIGSQHADNVVPPSVVSCQQCCGKTPTGAKAGVTQCFLRHWPLLYRASCLIQQSLCTLTDITRPTSVDWTTHGVDLGHKMHPARQQTTHDHVTPPTADWQWFITVISCCVMPGTAAASHPLWGPAAIHYSLQLHPHRAIFDWKKSSATV